VSEVLIVAKTRMKSGVCVGAIDLSLTKSLRLIPKGHLNQPEDSPLEVGDVYEVNYEMRNSLFPHGEDADAEILRLIDRRKITLSMVKGCPTAIGSSDDLFDRRLAWTASRKGYLDPGNPGSTFIHYSTQFWLPSTGLMRYEKDAGGRFHFWEPGTRRYIPWVGVANAPHRIDAGQLTRISLTRAFATSKMDHGVHWLQISGVY
jgi:ATP-dependent DNA helicase RecQ